MKCPTCKGTGEVETTVTEFGKPEVEKYKLTCHICNGRKEISK
jgi:DnaJ-class molecular chaperone